MKFESKIDFEWSFDPKTNLKFNLIPIKIVEF